MLKDNIQFWNTALKLKDLIFHTIFLTNFSIVAVKPLEYTTEYSHKQSEIIFLKHKNCH